MTESPAAPQGVIPAADAAAEVERLRALLQSMVRESGRSQAAVARRLGVAPSQLSLILNGHRGLRYRDLVTLPAALGHSPADFFAAAYGYEPRLLVEPTLVPACMALAELLVERKLVGEGDLLKGVFAILESKWMARR